MPKRYFKKIIPNPEKLRENKALGILGKQIYEPDLWHLNRRSIAKAFLNGLFWAFIPMPFQMVASALVAIPFRANIPLSIALVWLTNPLTMPFVFYFNYKVGAWILGDHLNTDFKLSVEWIWAQLEHIWLPLYLGSAVAGLFFGVVAYFAIHLIWRMHVIKRWKERKHKRAK